MATNRDREKTTPRRRRWYHSNCGQLLLVGLFFLSAFGGCIYGDLRIMDSVRARVQIGMTQDEVNRELGVRPWKLTPAALADSTAPIALPTHPINGEVWGYSVGRFEGVWAFSYVFVYFDRQGCVEYVGYGSIA